MQRLIKDANRVKVANGEMADLSIDSFADVTEAIHIIQTEMGITGTTAEEAEQTITGSIASMKSAWENWMVGLGDENADLEELTNQLVDTVVIAAENLIPRIGEIIGRLAQTVASKAPEIASKLGGALLELMPPELNSAIKSAMNAWDLEGTFQEKFSAAFTSMQGFVSQKMGEIFEKIGMGALGEKMTGAFNAISGAFMGAVNSFSSALEENLGPALDEVQPILDYFFGTIEDAAPWMEKLADVVGTVLGVAVSAAIKIFWNLVIAIGNVIEFITDCYNAVKKFVDDVYNFFTVTVPQAITDLGNWFAQLPGKIAGGLTNAVNKVKEFANNVKNKAVEAGKNFLNGVKGGFEEAVNFVAGIPGKILNALGDLGSLLVESGKSMLRGLANGIKQGVSSAIDAVKNGLTEIRSFFPFSPAKRGPFSGHGWVSYSGESIAHAMGEGFTRGVPSALRAFEGGMGRIDGVTSALGASAYNVGGASATSTVHVVGERDAQLIGMLGEILRAMPESMTPREFRRAVAACG